MKATMIWHRCFRRAAPPLLAFCLCLFGYAAWAQTADAFLAGCSKSCRNCALERAALKRRDLSEADLSGANLEGAVLHRARLMRAKFTGANLTGANFSGSNLMEATGLATATLTNVVWINTVCPNGRNSDRNGGTCTGQW